MLNFLKHFSYGTSNALTVLSVKNKKKQKRHTYVQCISWTFQQQKNHFFLYYIRELIVSVWFIISYCCEYHIPYMFDVKQHILPIKNQLNLRNFYSMFNNSSDYKSFEQKKNRWIFCWMLMFYSRTNNNVISQLSQL